MKGIPVVKNIRESFVKNRNESFKQLMSFNIDNELEKAERNLNVVNATQTFVSKAMKSNITQKRLRKNQNKSSNTNELVQNN